MRPSIPANGATEFRESHVQSVRQNRNTVYPSLIQDIESELAARLDAEIATLTRHFRARLPEGVAVAARVALVGVRELDLRELIAEPESFVVVGRHSEASMRAAGSASLSLRHVLLIPQPTEAGARVLVDIVPLAPTVRLEVWSRPLPVSLAERCTAYRLGDSLLLLAPVTPGANGSALHVAPAVASHLERTSENLLARGASDSDSLDEAEAPRITRISTAYTATDLPAADREARIVLEVWSGERRVRLPVRESWLARGILLGRNPDKCSHQALAEVLSSDHVSRCHLFVRREGDAVVFYDTASTSGVCVDDELVRRVAIPAAPFGEASAVNPARVVLSLTDDVFVTLHAARA